MLVCEKEKRRRNCKRAEEREEFILPAVRGTSAGMPNSRGLEQRYDSDMPSSRCFFERCDSVKSLSPEAGLFILFRCSGRPWSFAQCLSMSRLTQNRGWEQTRVRRPSCRSPCSHIVDLVQKKKKKRPREPKGKYHLQPREDSVLPVI